METVTKSSNGTATDASVPLLGKVAVVTGAARGIGRGIAIELARRGASVVANYAHSASAADTLVTELQSLCPSADPCAMKADVSRPEQVADLFERVLSRYGGLDIVVSNAGMEAWCPEREVTQELFDRVFGLNCRGQFFVAQQGLRHCRPGGRIILTSSVAATMSGLHDHALYAGSKAAVEGFARAFAADCGKGGVTVNAIAPGGVKTDMYEENSWRYAPGGYEGMPIEQIDKGLASICPLGRVGVPADIGKTVAMLCHEDSTWLNGQVIKLTGGSNA